MEADERTSHAKGRIGRYVLVRSLGAGGMGEVWKARAYVAAGLEKELCVKRIRRERLSNESAVERFIEEARLSMRLTHGNIVQVFDFGRTDDEYYLAMEWVDGVDLRRLLAHADATHDPLPAVVSVHVASCIARALAYAHSIRHGGRPVIHCDLKPANVLVSRAGEVKLADFGAATILGAGIAAGTAGYMAPERARGAAADPREDAYALGVVLVEMLSGRRPPHDPDALGAVPGDLRAIADGLLEPDASRRTSDLRAVADALESWVSRARADGGLVPASELARRTDAVPGDASGESPQAELETRASYERDGRDVGRFLEQMTETTGPAAARRDDGPGSPGVSGDRPGGTSARDVGARPGRGIAIALVGLAVVAAIATALGLATRDRGGSAADPPLAPRSDETAAGAPPPDEDAVAAGLADASAPARGDEEPSSPPVRPSPAARVAPAVLDLNAVPWAIVSVDGRGLGETPVFGVEVAPGAHTIVFSNPELGVRRTTRIRVVAGEHRHVVQPLEAATERDAPPPP